MITGAKLLNSLKTLKKGFLKKIQLILRIKTPINYKSLNYKLKFTIQDLSCSSYIYTNEK